MSHPLLCAYLIFAAGYGIRGVVEDMLAERPLRPFGDAMIGLLWPIGVLALVFCTVFNLGKPRHG